MGAAAAATVGKVVASVLVSKVASDVAKSIGLGDTAAGLVGIAAGGATFGYIGSMGGAAAGGASAGGTAAGQNAAQGMMTRHPGTDTVAYPLTDATRAGPEATPISPATAEPMPASAPQPTSERMIEAETTGGIKTGGDSWWEKLWNNERTGDTIVGAIGGMAQGYMRGKALEDRYKAQYDREDEISDRWKNYDPSSMPSLAYPQKATSGVLTRGMR